jgi:hypothetical protein
MDKELNVTNGAQPAPDIARDAQVPEEPRSKRARQGFRATTFSHIAAKAAANALFLKCLRAHSIPKEAPIVILDAYSASMGFELRSLSALQQAGFRNVYIVNPDEGICNAALGQGAMVFKGTWEEASAAWLAGDQRFAAFYLDLCSGSAAYIERQLRLAFDLALNTVVVAYTILERDFDGFPFIQRLKRLDDLMLGQNWQPGLVGWEASSLAYRTSAGHQAVTETWYR